MIDVLEYLWRFGEMLVSVVFYLTVGVWLAIWATALVLSFRNHGVKAWRYALLSIPFWVVFFARYPLAFVAVWLSDRVHLRWPFRWLDTIDNTLKGDEGWQNEHLWGSNADAYINQVRWLWRNGGNRFNYCTIGVPDPLPADWVFWDKVAIPLPSGRFLDLRFGWSDYSLAQRRKYVLTARVKTKP